MNSKTTLRLGVLAAALAASAVYLNHPVDAQSPPPPPPEMLDPALSVRSVIGGLTTPVGLVFLDADRSDSRSSESEGSDSDGSGASQSDSQSADIDRSGSDSFRRDRQRRTDMLVIEKNTGQVKLVVNGEVKATLLDLAVNFASERGLLGIALHPRFPERPFVYLYWTCRTATTPLDPFKPEARICDESAMLGEDTNVTLQVPLLGNRVDRFVWTGSGLKFDRNLIMLRSFQADGAPEPPGQNDAAQGPAGNHNGGVIRFGHDGKLYVIMGDQGRRGWLQNLRNGPTPPTDDDQFGGPEPDDAHLSGMILRLNADGTTPGDNPFREVGRRLGGEVGRNIAKIFAYGIRNSFGMAVDPFSGRLWIQVNGDDTFDEIQRVDAGLNSGWVQVIGPLSRIAEFKQIEITRPPGTLQQLRWPPSNLADTPADARGRLFMLPGAHYRDPEFSWRYAVAPGGIGFLDGGGLGREYRGDLFVGAARTTLEGGYLFRFNLSPSRRQLRTGDQVLDDRVADNNDKFDITESESLLVGRNFGVGTDIQSGPNGNLFVVSLDRGEIFEVFRARKDEGTR